MKNLLRAMLLALPFLAVPAQAHAQCCGDCGEMASAFRAKLHVLFTPTCATDWGANGYHPCQGPWYTYWPAEAHFTTPAHPEFPFWPSPMVSYTGPAPMAPAYPAAGGVYQPVNYPSYWYGH